MSKKRVLSQQLLLCGFLVFVSTRVQAQIIPDNTLSTEVSKINPNVQLRGAIVDLINGGQERGSNLFHSFSEFNISDGQRVYFDNPSGVVNILTRVTGNQASNLFGILGVNGAANLFLINPNGILFGQNARLDIHGSFVGTTANGVQFGNQGIFSATNPEAPGLLTINPSALFFNQINPNSQGIINRIRINNNDAALASTFSPQQGSRYWVGGNVTFDAGQWGVGNNRAELGGLAGNGSVALIGSGNQMQLAFPVGIPRADVLFKNNAFLFTTGGGAVTVNARNLSMSGNSFISTLLLAGEGQTGVAASDVVVNATGDVTLDGVSNISNLGLENSLGNTGNVAINAQSIRLTNQSLIRSDGALGRGNIILNAKDNISLDSNSFINTTGTQNSVGKSGDITITTRNINLSNLSRIISAPLGQGEAGKITLNAQEEISVNSGSNISSSSSASSFGGVNTLPSGNIEIITRTLTLDGNNSSVTSSNLDEGRGGDIRITADELIALNGSNTNISSTSSKGDAGNIQLETRALKLTNGGIIATVSSGSGNSGNLFVNASDSVSLSGITTSNNPQTGELTSIGSGLTTSSFGTGNGGELTINTQKLSISDGGYITTVSREFGRGGNLLINAKDSVEVVGRSPNIPSNISTSTLVSGDAGSLNINTGRFSIRSGAIVTTSTPGTGKGGNLTIDATGSIEVLGGSPNILSKISAESLGSGDAGDLTITTAQNLLVRDGGQVSTATSGAGKGGNLTVNASGNVEVIGASANNLLYSRLSTSANQDITGNAGDLTINAQNLLASDGGLVDAFTSGQGKGGNLTVNARGKIELVGTSALGIPTIFSTSAQLGSTGDAGDLIINAQDLFIRDGAQIIASTFDKGKAGNLTVNASESIQLIGQSANSNFVSGLFASSEKGATGDAGNLTVNTQNLLVRDGAQVIASTFNSGKGGNSTVNASSSIELIGKSANNEFPSGLLATAEGGSTGDAGDLIVNTRNLLARDGAGVFVASDGTGNSGILTINADITRLNNKASFNANTRSPNKDSNREQATINLNTQALIMRRGSNITTNATGANVIGGNININADVLAAFEDSDIGANSTNFRGGRVRITSQAIFGTQTRNFLTTQSDITATGASPDLIGSTEVNTPDVDSTQAIIELPEEVVDATRRVAQICPVNPGDQLLGEFTITGRGSLPPSPLELLPGTINTNKLATLDGNNSNTSNKYTIPNITQNNQNTIVEAQGWVKDTDGSVELVAMAPKATPSAPAVLSCNY